MGNTSVIADTVIGGLDVPWEMVYGFDEHLWITERKGLVSRIDPQLKTKTVILDITSTVFQHSESGLLAIAHHPDFPLVNEVFLVYTYDPLLNMKERLVKYAYMNGQLVNPQILLDNIQANTGHNGSRLQFLPDKTLLMTTGEAHDGTRSQNMNSLNGKTLRINTDGSVPADNPFPGSYIYTLGHRNAQGLLLAPNGLVYCSEHGPVNDDEFQIVEKGRNYGWPLVEGYCDQPQEQQPCQSLNAKEPYRTWTPTIAPGDLIWYENNSFPELHEKMLMVTLRTKKLVALQLQADGLGVTGEASYLQNMFGRLRAIAVGPDAEIYLATNGADAANVDPNQHSIIVLRPPLPVVGLDKKSTQNVEIWPNPATNQIVIRTGDSDRSTCHIFDQLGKKMISQEITENNNSIDISSLPGGLYFICLQTPGQKVVRTKLVKE